METASFYDNLEFNENKPSLKVLLQTNYSKEIRIAFREGQEMKEHKSVHPIVVQVLEGSIDFGISSERILLEKGMLISLGANVLHELKANHQSVVRLSIFTGIH